MTVRVGWTMVAGLALSAACCAGEAEPKDSQDAAGVVAMLKRIDAAAGANDAQRARDNLSEHCLAAQSRMEHPDGVIFLTKEALTRNAAKGRQQGRQHIVDCQALVVAQAQDAACMLLTSAYRTAELRGAVLDLFASAVYENGRWRLCMLLPRFADLRVVVEEVSPDTAAAKAGIQAGDVIVRCDGRDVLNADQLDGYAEWARRRRAEKPDAGLPRVELRRGSRRLAVEIPPGELGVKASTRLEGRSDTETLTGKAAAEHPAGAVMQQFVAALAKRDAAGATAAFSKGGLCILNTLADDGTKVVTLKNAGEQLKAYLAAIASAVPGESLRCTDLSLILDGNLALGGCRLRGESDDGSEFAHDALVILARYKGKWGIVTTFPPAVQLRLGLSSAKSSG